MSKDVSDLSTQVTRAVKAELARRDITVQDLVGPLGLGRNAIYARLRGERPFDMEEIERITGVLGISMTEFWTSVELGRSSDAVPEKVSAA